MSSSRFELLRGLSGVAFMLALACGTHSAVAQTAEPPLQWRELTIGMNADEAARRLRTMGFVTTQTEFGYRTSNENAATISGFPRGLRCQGRAFSEPACDEVFLHILMRPDKSVFVWNITVNSYFSENAQIQPLIEAAKQRYGVPSLEEWSSDTQRKKDPLPRWGTWVVTWGTKDFNNPEGSVEIRMSTFMTPNRGRTTFPPQPPSGATTQRLDLVVEKSSLIDENTAAVERSGTSPPTGLRF